MTIIDVSRHQGYVDWPKCKEAGVTHAWIKATGEETAGPNPYKDGRFLGNWNLSNGVLKRGAYHFMDGSKNSASGYDEAMFFIDTVTSNGGWGELRPVIDVEWPAKNFEIEQFLECMDEVWEACGKPPIVYTGRWVWDSIEGTDFKWISECPLWIASYTANCPAPPRPWGSVTLWQYTSKGRVAGIVGDVDMNRIVGNPKDVEL